MQNFACLLLIPGLWMHSASVLVLALLLFGAGWFELPLPPLRALGLVRLENLLGRVIRREEALRLAPGGRRKRFWAFLGLLAALVLCWALWVHELAAILFLCGIPSLVWCSAQLRAGGVDP